VRRTRDVRIGKHEGKGWGELLTLQRGKPGTPGVRPEKKRGAAEDPISPKPFRILKMEDYRQ